MEAKAKIIDIQTKLQLNPELTNIDAFRVYEKLTIANEQECAMASNHLVAVKARINAIEKEKDTVERPLREALTAFRDMANNVLRPLETIEKILKAKIGGFIKANQEKKEAEERGFRRQEAEKRRLLAQEQQKIAMATGDESAAAASLKNAEHANKLEMAPVDVHQTQRVDQGTVIHRWKWQWTVVDLSKVPPEYLMLDKTKINSIARSYDKEPKEIPGIRFDKEVSLGVRADK